MVLLQAVANAITTAHNANLAALLPEFAADHLEASIILFNLEAFLLQLQQKAPALGITDLTTPCYTGAVAGTAATAGNASAVCANPDSHAYWDGLHPSARVHELWGQAVAAQLMAYAPTAPRTSRKLLTREYTIGGLPVASMDVKVFGQPLYANMMTKFG